MITKTNISALVAEQTSLSKGDATAAVNAAIDAIVDGIKAGEKVQIKGLGSFEVRDTKARTGRNPATGQLINIAAGRKVSFRVASDLKGVI